MDPSVSRGTNRPVRRNDGCDERDMMSRSAFAVRGARDRAPDVRLDVEGRLNGEGSAVATPIGIRTATPEDLVAVRRIYRDASLSNAGDREVLLQAPESLLFSADVLGEGRTRVAVGAGGAVLGFAT